MEVERTVLFGGGCFWCTEAVFKMIKGVTAVLPGYAGGHTENPTYESICSGITGHAEVVKVVYDPKEVKFRDLLTVFFASHDPSTLNRQGNDIGTQYRSVIFYETEDQKNEIEDFIKELNASNTEGAKLVTQVEPLPTFYEAENYHKDYYAQNKSQSYCQIIINPKLEKVQEQFSHLLKKVYG
jgi:peptide-methionine (S)-S-oxide reductase